MMKKLLDILAACALIAIGLTMIAAPILAQLTFSLWCPGIWGNGEPLVISVIIAEVLLVFSIIPIACFIAEK
jgi:hypothetical protein